MSNELKLQLSATFQRISYTVKIIFIWIYSEFKKNFIEFYRFFCCHEWFAKQFIIQKGRGTFPSSSVGLNQRIW
jgi:hypothetical protein